MPVQPFILSARDCIQDALVASDAGPFSGSGNPPLWHLYWCSTYEYEQVAANQQGRDLYMVQTFKLMPQCLTEINFSHIFKWPFPPSLIVAGGAEPFVVTPAIVAPSRHCKHCPTERHCTRPVAATKKAEDEG